MSEKFIPVAGTKNRVFVKPSEAVEKTVSGIIIPDNAKEKPLMGTVVSISDSDEDDKKPKVKAGDTVLYGKYAGTEATVDGVDILIMRESDIVGKRV